MSALWPLALRAVRARPLRSALTSVAVALGIAVVLGVQIAMAGLSAQAADALVEQAGQSSLDVRVDAGSGLTDAQVSTLAGLTGVVQAAPLYEKRVTAGPVGSGLSGQTVTLVGLQDGAAALRGVNVVAGRLPHPGSTSEVAIDQGLASALSGRAGTALSVGQGIQMITDTGPDRFIVVGLTTGTTGGPAFTHSAVFADAAAMTGPFQLGLRTPLVALRFGPGATAVSVASEVHTNLGNAVTTYDPRAGASQPLADLAPLLLLVTVLSVIVGAGVSANSAALATSERRREIGLLRAAGASAQQVFRLFAAEVVLVAACGVPFGILAGIGLGALFDAGFAPGDIAGLPVAPSALQVLAAVVAGLGAAIAGGLMPALSAARMPILSALRAHPGSARQRVNPALVASSPLLLIAAALCFLSEAGGVVALGVALFLLGAVAALPIIGPPIIRLLAAALSPVVGGAGLAAANLARSRNRTALTAAGLSVSVATAVAVSALTAGALSASDSWVSHLFVGDVVVTSPVTQSDAVVTAVEHSPGVAQATALRLFSEPVAGAVQGIVALDPAAYESMGGLDVVTPDRSSALRSLEDGPSFLAPAALAEAAGWNVGTQLPVQTQKGIVYFGVIGLASHSFPAGDGGESLIMADDLARTYFGSSATGFDDLLVASRGAAGAVAATAATYGMQAVTVSQISDASRQALQHSIGLLLALAAIAVVMAMLAVVNTLVVNVRQGTRELALLRAVGLGSRQALRRVLTEAALLATMATLVGLGAGCLIAFPMLRASATPAFTPGFVFPLETAVTLAVMVVLGAVVATIGPARRAVRTSVVSALRHE